MARISIVCSVLACLVLIIHGKKIINADEENCEVCVKFLGRFIESLDDETKKSPEKIENTFIKFCKNTKKDDNRFCYYVGGLEESATGMLSEMSKPVSWSMPADKVCLKLYRKDQQICDIKYEKQVDLSTVNLKKLKVKDLKAILSDWDEQCRGCTEKDDYVRLIEELMPKYNRESWEKRQKNEL